VGALLPVEALRVVVLRVVVLREAQAVHWWT